MSVEADKVRSSNAAMQADPNAAVSVKAFGADVTAWVTKEDPPVVVPPVPVVGIPTIGGAPGYEIINLSDAGMQAEVALWKAAHGKYLRVDSTTGNQPQFQRLRNIVAAAGMKLMTVNHGTTGPLTDTSFDGAQATKWKDDPTICGMEICNEPDLNGWSYQQYANFSKAAAQRIKGIAPKMIVCVGAFFTGNGGVQAYLPVMIQTGVFQFADVLSMHLYDPPLATGSWSNWDRAYPKPGGFYNGRTARELLDKAGLQRIPIISTESGGPRDKYGETGQANIVRDALGQAKAGKIGSCCVYNMKPEVRDFFIDGHAAYGAYQAAAA